MLISYLKRHYKILLLFATFTLVFALVFSLYQLEAEAVLYASLLCLVGGCIFFGFGLHQYCKKHRRLMYIMQNLDVGIKGLPAPSGKIEEDYQNMLRSLFALNLRVVSEADGEKRDSEDYYTLWAHQIKTPLAAMHLLLSGDDERDRLLAAELFKTEQYVDMVLQYIRLGSESSDLVLKKYELDDIIRGCLRKHARLFALKKLEFSFTETALTVLSDEKWLSFVIEQVFSNSLKYTPNGKISIYAQGEHLIIEDTGIGIRPEDLPRVCEKGYTGACGRADKKSTGIGLFLCKSILGKLGHGIEISSKVGVGTRVSIDLTQNVLVSE